MVLQDLLEQLQRVTKVIVGSGVPLDRVMAPVLQGSPGCRVFLEAPDSQAQLAPLERKEKRVTVRMEPQVSQDNLGPRVSGAYGDLLETLAPKVTEDRKGVSVRLERRANVDSLAQWDPRACRELLGILEPRVLKGHQDPQAVEERRGSLAALGTLPWDLLVMASKERREMWDPLDPKELSESKGSQAHLAWFFLEILAPRETLETGVPLASLAEQDPRVTQGLLEKRETLGGLALQDLSAPEDEMVKLERKVTRAPRVTQVCLEKLASVAFGGHPELGDLWVRRETREILERMDEMAALDHLDPRVTEGSQASQDPLDVWWTRDLEPERRESLGTVDRRVLGDQRETLALLEPLGRGALMDFGDPQAHRETQVSEAQQEKRVTGAPLAWMAAVGWMGNQEPLAPLGFMVLQAKLGTRGEMGFRASEENRDLLAPLVPPEHWESQAMTASQA